MEKELLVKNMISAIENISVAVLNATTVQAMKQDVENRTADAERAVSRLSFILGYAAEKCTDPDEAEEYKTLQHCINSDVFNIVTRLEDGNKTFDSVDHDILKSLVIGIARIRPVLLEGVEERWNEAHDEVMRLI